MSVIPKAYATSDPAADPRPGPTGMFCSRAQRMKSAVIRKYDAKPSWLMTSASYLSRPKISGSAAFSAP